jgi:cytochrome P450
MRLYPPVPRFDRQAVEPTGSAIEVEPGDIVSIWPWMLHRHARLGTIRTPSTSTACREGRAPRFNICRSGRPRTCVGAHIATAEARPSRR